MQPPFFCDYGSNIKLGERVFFNFNCVVLDVCPVQIGSFTLFGPAVQVTTDASIQRRAAPSRRVR
jgi:maltose O-acetyltransferase